MNKNESLDILQACIDQLSTANEEEIFNMRNIYMEEMKNFTSHYNDIEILLPYDINESCTCEDLIVIEEGAYFKDIVIKPTPEKKMLNDFNKKPYNESILNELEGAAA